MTTSPSIQREKPAPLQPRGFPFRPLLSISGVRSLLPGYDEDDVMNEIEHARIPWVFDISLGNQNRGRELRVLPAAVDEFRTNPFGLAAHWDWEQRVKAELLGAYRLDWISALDARILLNCSCTQMQSIITLGRLALAPGSLCRRGPNGSPRVTLASFLRWLKRRRIF